MKPAVYEQTEATPVHDMLGERHDTWLHSDCFNRCNGSRQRGIATLAAVDPPVVACLLFLCTSVFMLSTHFRKRQCKLGLSHCLPAMLLCVQCS